MKEVKTGGKIKIDRERCKGCALCVGACPQKILQLSEDVNKKGRRYVVVTDASRCTGCGMCFIMCPDCAIEIEG